jgi:hypothetical protein
MIPRKTLVLAGLVLIAFPLRHAELLSRVADECKCDRTQLSCKILCSGVGSGQGTGGSSSTFDIAPGIERPAQERPTIVPRTEDKDTKSPSGQNR